MQGHPATKTLRQWVLAWFALALLAATASPLVQARSFEFVCSGSGGASKLMVRLADGMVHASHDSAGAQCPLCLPMDAPPAAAPDTPAFAAIGTATPSLHPQPPRLRMAQRGPPARAPPFQPSVS